MVICEKCKRIMKYENSLGNIGIVVIELTEKDEPYRIWYGDRLTCSGCNNTVISNFGSPTRKHEEHFEETVQALRASATQIPGYILEVK